MRAASPLGCCIPRSCHHLLMPPVVPSNFLPTALRELPHAPVWVGLSGGLDSSVLLHVLAQHAPARASGLYAVHIHHGLHADADAWADHCVRFCAALGIELKVVPVSVARNDGNGLEAAARE